MEHWSELIRHLYAMIQNGSFYWVHVLFEILFLFILIYAGIRYVRGTRAFYILTGIFGTYLALNIAAELLDFTVILWIMEKLWSVLTVACVVIFQPELRRGFASLGSVLQRGRHRQRELLDEISAAVLYCAERRIGALIVLENHVKVRSVSATGGVSLDCKVSAPLLECIFMNKSPLHDGAVVISANRMTAAHVILPLSRMEGREVRFGTRHRAALGITEETDAVAVAVSEERGTVSVAYRGKLEVMKDAEQLQATLSRLLSEVAKGGGETSVFEPEIKQTEIDA